MKQICQNGEVIDPGATVAVVPVGGGQLEENEVAIDEDVLTLLREQAYNQ